MHKVVCPHCKSHRILTSKIPKDVIVVMPCPACHEWVVLFWNRVLAVSRRILRHGTFEERKMHIANVIAQFFEQGGEAGDDFGLESMGTGEGAGTAGNFSDEAPEGLFELRNALNLHGRDDHQVPEAPKPPITSEEIDRFVKIDLRQIDDGDYFRKNLGR